MNTINVEINFTKGTNKLTGINLITGDYASTKMVFQFDRPDGTKVLEMKNPSGEVVYLGEIVNNEVILAAVENGLNYSIFETEGRYIYEVSLYNGDSKLTSVKGELPVAKEQVIIDGEVVEPYLPLFDELMQQISTAITETNNLDIEAEKVEHTTTITITKKNGRSYDVEILDGEKGDKGDKGDAGAIKVLKVNELPTEDIKDDTIYLVPMPVIQVETLPTTGQMYTIYVVTSTQKRYRYVSGQWVETLSNDNNLEYMYIDNTWELVGQADIEIDLTDYVKFTDYPTTDGTKSGTLKVNTAFATTRDNSGNLYAQTKTYIQYIEGLNNMFISKGTLENVLTASVMSSSNTAPTSSTKGRLGQLHINTTDNSVYQLVAISGNTYTWVQNTNKSYVDNLVGDINSALDSISGEVI